MDENRRTLLASAAASAVAGGCLDTVSRESGSPEAGSDDDNVEYAECVAPFVDYDELPDDLAAEVDAAFEDGAYETDGGLPYDQAVNDSTPLWKDGDSYEHEVERDGERHRLSFERQTAFSSPRDVSISNDTDESITVTVTVADGTEGELLVDEVAPVEPDDRERLSTVKAFGDYDVEIELEDGRRETKSWEVSPPRHEVADGLFVRITDDEISISPEIMVYDYEPCSSQWTRSP
ncbi:MULTISPECIES: hypothetical protein [Natrialbaceae]|uniref:hypothetical protein n=1 Tax=Natrialbaceae TaxID=1644061 RepID=UPI00207C3D39|nr:hypothetical protein [Natronococcus sp. CG52]